MRTLILAALVALAALLITPWVHSWVPTGQTWPTMTVPFSVNPGFPAVPGGTAIQQAETIRCAAEAWRLQARIPFEFQYVGSTTSTSLDPFDGINVVQHSTGSGGGGLLAVTIRGFVGSTMEGFDVVCFAANDTGPIGWNGVGDPGAGEEDIAAVVTHEFGHALGLDHTATPDATMFADAIGVAARTLSADDIAGAKSLYGDDPSIVSGPVFDDIVPASGSATGGDEVFIIGHNFTWGSDTTLTIDGQPLDPAFFEIESSCRLRILAMPPHLPGPATIAMNNELGSYELVDAFLYTGATGGPAMLQEATKIATPGTSGVELEISGTFDFPLGGYSIGCAFDPTTLTVSTITLDGTEADGAEYFASDFDNTSGWLTIEVEIDITPPIDQAIPAGADRSLARTQFDVAPSAMIGFSSVVIADGLGSPPVDLLVTGLGGTNPVFPTTISGGVLIADGPTFVRGDTNGDGFVEVSDVQYHLEWLFLLGPSTCPDAHDSNDDGRADVADAIWVLAYLFLGGAPPTPPFPFPGVDPSLDPLGCN
ncbi:MAG: matrixin family metalloprotease [Planctomycetes bacterium]|nr:matrixin family metalloprotease [Planctomycetota bacterium]